MNKKNSEGPATILIVDDDPDIVLTLQDLLHSEGYKVRVAATGRAAWDCLTRESVSSVVLDVCLPDIDGLLILEKLVDKFPALPIIILSGLPNLNQVTGPLDQQGAFASLLKPINRDQIKTTVRQAVKTHQLAIQVKHAQQALSDSQQRFQAIFQTSTDAIVLADDQGRITGWNSAAESMFGYSEEEVIGQPLTLLMPERFRELHRRGLQRVSRTKETKWIGKTLTLFGLKKNGLEFPIELSLNTWTCGVHPAYSGFIRDISERGSLTSSLATVV